MALAETKVSHVTRSLGLPPHILRLWRLRFTLLVTGLVIQYTTLWTWSLEEAGFISLHELVVILSMPPKVSVVLVVELTHLVHQRL